MARINPLKNNENVFWTPDFWFRAHKKKHGTPHPPGGGGWTTKNKHSETKKENYLINEFNTLNFERNFKLSERVNTEKVSAKIEDGVLKVDLPIHEQVKPQKIDVVGISWFL